MEVVYQRSSLEVGRVRLTIPQSRQGMRTVKKGHCSRTMRHLLADWSLLMASPPSDIDSVIGTDQSDSQPLHLSRISKSSPFSSGLVLGSKEGAGKENTCGTSLTGAKILAAQRMDRPSQLGRGATGMHQARGCPPFEQITVPYGSWSVTN